MKNNSDFKIGKFYLVSDNTDEQYTKLDQVKLKQDTMQLKPKFGFENEDDDVSYDNSYEMSIEETYQEIIKEIRQHKKL
jgi:hypothetical protein